MENFIPDPYRSYTTNRSMIVPTNLPAGWAKFLFAMNVFLSLTASLGNVIILIALHKVFSLHPPTKLLFRWLAVTDLCVGLISQPMSVIEFYLPDVVEVERNVFQCVAEVHSTSTFVFCMLSIFTSVAISVDRLLALLLQLRYRHIVTLRRVGTAIICFSLICVGLGLLDIFLGLSIPLALAVVFVTLSVFISIFCYIKICLRLRQHQAQVIDNLHQRQRNGGEISLNIARYKKTVASIAWIQLALVVCYLPFGIVFVKRYIFGWFKENSDIVWFSVITLMYLNSSLNPFLYSWKISEVRKVAKDTIKQFFCLS